MQAFQNRIPGPLISFDFQPAFVRQMSEKVAYRGIAFPKNVIAAPSHSPYACAETLTKEGHLGMTMSDAIPDASSVQPKVVDQKRTSPTELFHNSTHHSNV